MKMLIFILGFAQIFSEVEPKDSLKNDAYEVLRTKCNVCHVKKNPSKFFTPYNMEGLAPKIYKQVFVKKRMPKGKEIQLTQKEYDQLEQWLETQNLNQ